MTDKQKASVGCITILLRLFVTTPIWFYLLYSILIAIEADRLVWFLFWIYFSVIVLISIIEVVAKSIIAND